jgi:hypothetical protein
MKANLSNPVITRAQAEAQRTEKRIEIWDTQVAGLHALITDKGTATYYLKYRSHGRQRKVKLGRHGRDLTVAEARTKAKRTSHAIADGIDPQHAREVARGTPTVAGVAEKYLASLTVAPRTVETYRQRIQKHILPALGARPVTAIEKADVRALHRKITQAGHPTNANRVVTVLAAMYSWAIDEWPGVVVRNPARGAVKRNAENKRTRILTADERASLLTAIDSAETIPKSTKGHVSKTYANAMRMAIYTGMRPRDLVTLRHENITRAISHGRKMWIAEWAAQGDDKTKKANTRRILNSAAVAIVEAQAEITGGRGWVFPTSAGTQTTSRQLAASFAIVRELAGLPMGVSLYAAGRHSYVSEGVMAGVPLAVMGADLDNQSAVHRYAHLERAVDEGVSERVLAAMQGGGEPKPSKRTSSTTKRKRTAARRR